MSNWLFLSKNGQDEYVNMLAAGSGHEPMNTDDFDYEYDCIRDKKSIVLRGILKYKIMHKCLQDAVDFLYIDSGYFGNATSEKNKQGHKLWHRIVKNDLQHKALVQRPADRWEALKLKLGKRKFGKKIIIAAPDDKPCRYYGIDREKWLQDTLTTIAAHTDRPVVVRERSPKRSDRVLKDPLSKVLNDDVHALVTFNSIAGVEAVMSGVPAIVLAPSHAADPVSSKILSDIETPYWPDEDLRHAWVHHLAYGQYHVSEMKNGRAWKMLGN